MCVGVFLNVCVLLAATLAFVFVVDCRTMHLVELTQWNMHTNILYLHTYMCVSVCIYVSVSTYVCVLPKAKRQLER